MSKSKKVPSKPTIAYIVVDWLMTRGYNGLYNKYSECGCSVHDILSCDISDSNCVAAYTVSENCDCLSPESNLAKRGHRPDCDAH